MNLPSTIETDQSQSELHASGSSAARPSGQVAIVTGATGGIGSATVAALIAEGFRVVAVGTSDEKLDRLRNDIGPSGAMLSVFRATISEEGGVEELLRHVDHTHGQLDLLVNCAGVSSTEHELGKLSQAEIERVFNVNTTAAFLLTNSALSRLRVTGGQIINISSQAALRSAMKSTPTYSASKAALNSLSDWVNASEARFGVRACAICPGEVNTPMIERRRDHPDPERRAHMLQPEDIARIVLFVATTRAGVRLNFIPVAPCPVPGDLKD